jgi:predicted RNA binding protein YcfA (HicA-like mRNA interferase family)
MKYSEVERNLSVSGCRWYENGKRHPIWINPMTGIKFPLSYHKHQEVKPGTLKSISKLSGIQL